MRTLLLALLFLSLTPAAIGLLTFGNTIQAAIGGLILLVTIYRWADLMEIKTPKFLTVPQ